jgi:ribosome maturation factor RimP
MEYSSESGELFEIVGPLVRGLGFEIVELIGKQRTSMYHVNLVIHGSLGVDLGATTNVYKVVFPRLTVAMDTEDIHLEVSSPGVYRKFKDAREFAIFLRSKVKIISEDEVEWLVGTIIDATDSQVSIESGGETHSINYVDIRKAQLDYP